MTERSDYVFMIDEEDRGTVMAASAALLAVLAPVARDAILDGYTQWPDAPDDVAEIERSFAELYGAKRAGIRLDLSNPTDEGVLGTFAPWSIHADVFGDGPVPIANYHDGCLSSARLTEDELASLRAALAGGNLSVELMPAREWKVMQRAARRKRRRFIVGRLLRRS